MHHPSLASLGLVWGHSGQTLDLIWYHRTPQTAVFDQPRLFSSLRPPRNRLRFARPDGALPATSWQYHGEYSIWIIKWPLCAGKRK